MKHNTLIGITLVGLIMIGFSWYNTKQFNKQQEYQRQQDSIAQVRALDYAAEMAKNNPDTAIIHGAAPTTNSVVLTNNKVGQKYNNVYANSFLEEAFGRESELVTLENDKVKNRRVAQIKDYALTRSLFIIPIKLSFYEL